jgi:hypothetical protein
MNAHLSRVAIRSRKFEFMVVICVIGLFATWLLHSLNKAQTEIEQIVLNTQLNNMRLELLEAWTHKNLMHETVNIEAFKDSNPIRLIATKPSNYIGERAITSRDMTNIWYFDTRNKRLTYVYNDGREAAYILACRAGVFGALNTEIRNKKLSNKELNNTAPNITTLCNTTPSLVLDLKINQYQDKAVNE